MSARWEARFEIVSGPYDGLTFVVANEGLSVGSEILEVPGAQELYLRDFAGVAFEVGSEGARLDTEGAYTLNGEPVSGGRALSDGDTVKIGATEVVLVGHSSASTSGGQADSDREDTQGGSGDTATATERRCLRPGCGAMNPPTAKWCLVCGWDLEGP